MSFPLHRPSCFETGEPIDIEHHIMYNAIAAGQPELISLEKSLKEAMVPAGTARESEYGREFPLFEVEATTVEPIFERLYSFIFDMEPDYSAKEMGSLAVSLSRIHNGDGATQVWLSSGRMTRFSIPSERVQGEHVLLLGDYCTTWGRLSLSSSRRSTRKMLHL